MRIRGLRRRTAGPLARARRAPDEAYDAITRLEQVTALALAHIPTDELTERLPGRIRAALGVDSAAILMVGHDRRLEVRAAEGISGSVLESFRGVAGESLVGRVAAEVMSSGRPYAEHLDQPDRRGDRVVSAAAAPMLAGGRPVGAVVVGSSRPTEFDEESLRLLQLAADRSAGALESARLRDAERRLLFAAEHAQRHLRLLGDASRVFMESVTDPEAALVRLVQLALRDFAAFGAVYIAEDGKDLRLLVAQHGQSGPHAAADDFSLLPVSVLGEVSTVIASGQSRLLRSLEPGPGVDDDFRATLNGLGVTSLVIVPIVVRGAAYGALLLGTSGSMRGFRPSDLAAAEELAHRAALAVQSSMLYEQARDSAQLAETHAAQARENEARLSALIQSSPVAIVDLALDGAIRSWNVAAATLFDWPDSPASGWAASFDAQVERWIATLRREATKDGAPAHMECSFTRGDGVEKSLSLAVSPVQDHTGAMTGSLLVANDDTERRQLARQFHEAQRLEAVGRMAGGVAHDFNNLLTVILGYADSLLRRMSPDDPHRERIATIARAGNRGAALTRQLLAISRKQVVAPIVLRPVDVFMELEHMMRQVVGEDVSVLVGVQGDERPVRIDKNQFEQVLLNLATNARDAMPGGGELILATQPATDPAYVSVAVRDSGGGMDEETLAHCLEPFYTTKQRGDGTGLGLAAVHGIITQSGGDVIVTSRPGAGTTVTLLLPAVEAPLDYAPVAELPTPTSTARPETGHILVVEDETELRGMARRLLRERGYTVLHAESAERALSMLEEYDGPLDLLLTDVAMPGMKGPELARRVTEHRQVPVLFMSGFAEELSSDAPDVAAPTAFLAKPFTPDQLVDSVRAAIVTGRDAKSGAHDRS